MHVARVLPILILLAACGDVPSEEPSAPETSPPRLSAAPIDDPAADARREHPPPPAKDTSRRRRHASLNGWVDLTKLPDDLRYVLANEEATGVVELEQGTYRLVVFRGDKELDRVTVPVRVGAVTHLTSAALTLENQLGKRPPCHVGCRVIDPKASWIAEHQATDGSWGGAKAACDQADCDAVAPDASPAETTGLFLLGLLGAGETHNSGEYKEQVKRGLRYLKNAQSEDGWFVAPGAAPARTQAHAITTLAMTEAYGVTGSRLFKGSAQHAVDALRGARDHGMPWRRNAIGGPDAETTVWAVFCLRSAQMSELDLPDGTFADANAALDAFGDPGTTPGLSLRESAGLTVARIFAGADPRKSATVQSGIERLLRNLPEPSSDPLYVYFGTMATFQAGGPAWRTWNKSLKAAVVETQHVEKGTHVHGTWSPAGPEAVAMGRLTTTAVATLTLSIYYRYGRVFGNPR